MQKISISGKGGTGKSMLTALLSKVFSEKGYTVFTVDSDESNPGLYRMLGFSQAPRPLMDLFGGEKKVLEEMKKPVSPEERNEWQKKERFSPDELPGEYILAKDRLRILTVGKITAAFEGCACAMGEVIKMFLERLVLKNNEVVIVDMEAGVEHFGRGVDKSLDAALILVEPSFESAALAVKVSLLARQSGMREVWAVLNKIPSKAVEEKLRERLKKAGIKVIGSIPYDPQIAESCMDGIPFGESQAKEEVKKIVGLLLQEKAA
jgi:CO dehydrogenase maturation factor